MISELVLLKGFDEADGSRHDFRTSGDGNPPGSSSNNNDNNTNTVTSLCTNRKNPLQKENRQLEVMYVDGVSYSIPTIDDRIDIESWFSKPLVLPIEEESDKKNNVWIFLKSVWFKWNGFYNSNTVMVKFCAFITYFVVGISFYCHVEGWDVIEA